jgi:hypothetical protein
MLPLGCRRTARATAMPHFVLMIPMRFFAILSGSYLAKAGYRQVNPFFPERPVPSSATSSGWAVARSKSREVACGKRVATSLDTNGRFRRFT